jgi:hypothetical protein
VDYGLAACAAGVRVAGRHAAAELGCDYQAVPARGVTRQTPADDLLGAARVVDIRRVYEVTAMADIVIQNERGCCSIASDAEFFTERHGSQAEGTHPQA